MRHPNEGGTYYRDRFGNLHPYDRETGKCLDGYVENYDAPSPNTPVSEEDAE